MGKTLAALSADAVGIAGGMVVAAGQGLGCMLEDDMRVVRSQLERIVAYVVRDEQKK